MASGQIVVQVMEVFYPTTVPATPIQRVGGSSPVEGTMFHAFDAATIEYLDFLCLLMPNYGGGGLTFTHPWAAATATTGVTRWGIAIRRIADDAEDLDTSHTYDYNATDDTTASATGELSYPTTAFTDGADMDSWAVGEMAIVRVRREATHANDTMAGDAQLLGAIFAKET